VQDLEMSAYRRLDEATALYVVERNHTAIYVAGLAAEMYLKTACFFLGGAKPADPVAAFLEAVRPRKYRPAFDADYEAGHGLLFWAEELKSRRERLRLPKAPSLFSRVIDGICMDWFVGMRYRPGCATGEDAARFITYVEWLASNHPGLRS